MNIFGVAILVCLFQCAHIAFGADDCSTGAPCKGYKITVDPVTHGTNNRVKVPPPTTATLSDDCKLSINVCFNVTVPFQSAKITYKVSKMITIKEEKNKDLGEAMAELKLLDDYPYPISKSGIYCSNEDKPIDVCPYANLLPLATGKPVCLGTVEVYYDNQKKGDTFEVKVLIEK